jgi:hypothetical protein
MSDEPREYTNDEVREMFLEQCKACVRYWRSTEIPSDIIKSNIERGVDEITYRMEGVLFSLLVLLDGGSGMPGFIVCPSPHHSDKEYCKEEGEDWFPQAPDDPQIDHTDIAGGLHEHLHQAKTSTVDPLVRAQNEVFRLKKLLRMRDDRIERLERKEWPL